MALRAPRIVFNRDRGGIAPLAVRRVDVSRAHGVSPASMVLDVIPIDLANLQTGGRVGSLVIEYENQVLTIPDCLIDQASFHGDPGARVTSLVIFDRRWKWRYGSISGHYNRRNDNGDIIANTSPAFIDTAANSERTPRELATLLLEAMGETTFDATAMPEDTRPEVEWNDDIPARQLSSLCDLYGCRVVLQWSNRVVIHRLPIGRGLPTNLPVIRLSTTVDTRERPNRITVATSPIVYQKDFFLEAVGEDGDGSIKPLKQLSFAPDPTDPDGGFAGEDSNFTLENGFEFDETDKLSFGEALFRLTRNNLLNKSIFKWYRIITPFQYPDGWRAPDGSLFPLVIDQLADILPILNYRSTSAVEQGLKVQQESLVYGTWTDGEENLGSNLVPLPDKVWAPSRSIVPGGYRVSQAKGLVAFSRPIVRFDESNEDTEKDKFLSAKLVLRACFHHRLSTGAWRGIFFSREQPEPKLGTQELVIKRPELIVSKRLVYKDDSFDNPDVVENNRDAVELLANEYITEVERQFFTQSPAEAVYAGFYPQIELDGSIRTVAFSIDAENRTSPITTTVYKDQDLSAYGNLNYLEMRRVEQVRDIMIARRISTSTIERRALSREARLIKEE